MRKPDFEGLDVFLSPREGILFEMVKEYKYGAVRDMGGVLGEMLVEEVVERLSGVDEGSRDTGGSKDFGAAVVIVPLPTISKHVRERGFDHTWRLAKEVARRIRWAEEDSGGGFWRSQGGFWRAQKGARAAQLLVREGSSVQVGKEAEERERQAEEAYRADFRAISRVLGDSERMNWDFGAEKGGFETKNEQPTVVLIDDVWTTGASMRAGVKVLREVGVEKIMTAVICAGKERA